MENNPFHKELFDIMYSTRSIDQQIAIKNELGLSNDYDQFTKNCEAMMALIERAYELGRLHGKSTKGMMAIPIFEIVDVPQYIDWRTAYAVHVNGKKVTIFTDRRSAVEWIREIQDIIGIDATQEDDAPST